MLKEIEGFPGYYTTDDGRVWSERPWRGKCGRWLKGRPNNKGYYLVNLYVNGKRYGKLIHRLVAATFLPNPNNLPEVNHKDERASNNKVENLEWCDREFNINYGNHNTKLKATKQRIYGKPVVQLTLDGYEVARYCCAHEATRKTGIAQGSINQVCRGERKTCGGYRWAYLSDINK